MKVKMRCGIFETNSSITHSLVIMPKDRYNKWMNEEGIYAFSMTYLYWLNKSQGKEPVNGQLYTLEEALAFIPEKYDDNDYYDINDFLADCGFYTFESWNKDNFFNESEHEYTSESGDKIVIRCKYGYD